MNILIEGLTPFHPLMVHFPVALLVTGLLVDVLAWWRRSERLAWAGLVLLVAAACFAVPTALTGWLDHEHAEDLEGGETVMWWHFGFALTTSVAALTAAVLRWRQRAQVRFGLWTGVGLVLAILVGVTGFLGGWLAYELGAGVKPVMEQVSHEHES